MKKSVKQILLLFASFIFIVIGSSAIWVLSTFQRLNMDELVYELSQPLKGTGSDMLTGYILKAFVPAVAVTIVIVLLNVLKAEALEKIRGKIRTGTFLASLLFSLICVIVFWNRLDITEYLVNLSDTSTFIDDNYVDPKDVTISFPQEKRNLIYIFLESMEITYADKANGGGFDYNCIPELTKLAESEECFTAGSGLNGGYVLPGTSWTMGGMFAQTSGLPLKTNLANNMMDTQESFFSGATCLGDVLKKEGYNQELLIGSDAVFGGRKLYFTEHGGYDIHDYNYALENGLIPEGYHVFWGYEDEKLFENEYDSDTNTITVKVDDIVNVDGLKGVMLYLYDDNEKKLGKVKASLAEERSYMAQINLDKYGSCKVIQVMAKGKKETLLGQLDGNLTLAAHENLDYYIELFKERENLALIMAGSGNISSNANEESGEYCSIMVDGVEYASDETGLHVAVYDYDKGEVIDSACFNMFDIAGTYEFCHVEADVRGDTG
jgi:hypothetical protein